MHDSTLNQMLVQHAAGGDELAWADIVRSFTPLLVAVCRQYRLSNMDADDVAGRVWMHLVTSISRLREPAALPGWLQTTTRRECQAVLRRRDDTPLDDREIGGSTVSCDARLLAEEQWVALREAIDGLCPRDQALLAMLFSDPPTSYLTISETLRIPVGAIGPTRKRILTRLRRAEVWRHYKPTL